MTFDPQKATSPPFIEPYFFLVNLDTHTYQNQLKPACIKFFPRLDLKMVNFGLLQWRKKNYDEEGKEMEKERKRKKKV